MKIKKIIKLINIFKTPFFFLAWLKGSAAGTEHEKILKTLNCSHIVDIGANRGQFALIARKCFPTARIDSFEPLIEACTIYRSAFKKDKAAYLHPYAIGPEKGKVTIHVSKHDDSSSLLPISEIQEKMFHGTEEREKRTIDVLPLTEVLNKEDIQAPALLKIDVQGYELQVLKGCNSLLNRFEYIYAECSFIELYDGQSFAYDIIDYLQQKAFKFKGIYNVFYDNSGCAVQGDFFFKKTI